MTMLGVLALMRLMQVFGQVTYRLLVIYLPTISFDLDVLKGYVESTTHKRVTEEDNDGDDACSTEYNKRVTEEEGNLLFTCELLIYHII
jgi:hypothetical protein